MDGACHNCTHDGHDLEHNLHYGSKHIKDQCVYIMDAADAWGNTVRDLKDAGKADGFEPYDVERICRDILRYVRRVRIREIGRFKQRTGLEYEAFLKSMESHDKELVTHIVSEDDFWDATIHMSGR